LQEKAKKIMKIICELKTTAKKNNILKECAEMFYYEKFEDQLDSNVNLIGFKNGVYDLELLEFREGRPDDYISFSTNINHQDYDPENKVNEEVMEFVRKVMPKPHLLEYLMKCFASFLSGKNKEEKFHIWTGSGSNGEILNCHKGSSKVARLLIKVWSNILLKLSSRRIFVLLL
jgi:phage/plasmid-associated DNA primase